MRYLITWSATIFGESLVDADGKDEAGEKARAGKDFEFDRLDEDCDWDIETIEEAPDRKSYEKD